MRFIVVVLLAAAASAQPLAFVVSNDSDAGAGSLRQALVDANTRCDEGLGCSITFTTAGPIRLQTALPAIVTRGALTIEGTPARIVIDGSALIEGSGLEIRATEDVTLRNIVIDAFPGDGVNIVTGSSIDVRIQRSAFTRSRFRGLSMQAPRAWLVVMSGTFDDNGWSGLALWAAGMVQLFGVSCSGNGASGIFVWNAGLFQVSGGTLNDNVQFGVAVVPNRRSMMLLSSEIRGNGVRNVDWGLDGESSRGAEGVPDAPEVLSARYDRITGITTVRGVLRSAANQYSAYEVLAFAGELEVDGTAGSRSNAPKQMIFPVADFPRPREIPFTFELRNAPPGTYVSAQGIDYVNYPLIGSATEVSRAVRVE